MKFERKVHGRHMPPMQLLLIFCLVRYYNYE
nr:MAG TPA: hypothetical protein [Caudoviricetes sp.]